MKIFQNAIYVAGDLIGDSINRGKEYLAKYDFAGVMIWNASNVGINYDVVVFTNLTPEHIEAHGGFENYKKAKKQLFVHTKHSHRKKIQGQAIQ